MLAEPKAAPRGFLGPVKNTPTPSKRLGKRAELFSLGTAVLLHRPARVLGGLWKGNAALPAQAPKLLGTDREHIILSVCGPLSSALKSGMVT